MEDTWLSITKLTLWYSRIEDKDTGKITEHTYKSEHHTKRRLMKEVGTNKHITLATDEGVYHLIPNPFNIDFNNDAPNNF
tara:strand:+ start:654 stop:893 length:240 start_codon:yes stop_codon:yes gene_type:complete